MASPYDLVSKPITVTPAGVTVDFSAIGIMGSVSIANLGPNSVFFAFDSTPPAAALSDGVFECDTSVAPIFNWDRMAFKNVQLIVAGGQSAVVQIVAVQDDGGSNGFNG
ncbi:MAG: hypothetical protein GZ088_09720 [Acidipila sp.]|nr:hypothetical protein [Acidipila sp.]